MGQALGFASDFDQTNINRDITDSCLLWIAPAGLMEDEHLPVEHDRLSQDAARDRQVIYDTGTQGQVSLHTWTASYLPPPSSNPHNCHHHHHHRHRWKHDHLHYPEFLSLGLLSI